MVLVLAGCVATVGGSSSSDPSADPNEPVPVTGEADGTYLDVTVGACIGGVGGAIRCAGSPCDAMLGEAACAATTGCIVSYTQDAAGALTFRSCFPIDTRATAAGSCDALAAADCVTRADCRAVYQGTSIYGSFVRCETRP